MLSYLGDVASAHGGLAGQLSMNSCRRRSRTEVAYGKLITPHYREWVTRTRKNLECMKGPEYKRKMGEKQKAINGSA
jgi:hypothetical protein